MFVNNSVCKKYSDADLFSQETESKLDPLKATSLPFHLFYPAATSGSRHFFLILVSSLCALVFFSIVSPSALAHSVSGNCPGILKPSLVIVKKCVCEHAWLSHTLKGVCEVGTFLCVCVCVAVERSQRKRANSVMLVWLMETWKTIGT